MASDDALPHVLRQLEADERRAVVAGLVNDAAEHCRRVIEPTVEPGFEPTAGTGLDGVRINVATLAVGDVAPEGTGIRLTRDVQASIEIQGRASRFIRCENVAVHGAGVEVRCVLRFRQCLAK